MKAIQQASGVDFNAEGLVNEFAKQRLWLPARLMGGALRSQTKVAEAAYISGLIAALPSLIDVTMTVQDHGSSARVRKCRGRATLGCRCM